MPDGSRKPATGPARPVLLGGVPRPLIDHAMRCFGVGEHHPFVQMSVHWVLLVEPGLGDGQARSGAHHAELIARHYAALADNNYWNGLFRLFTALRLNDR